MKKFLGTTMLAFVTLIALAQPNKNLVTGTVTENNGQTPVAGATVQLGGRQTITNEKGEFSFDKTGKGRFELTVNSLGLSVYKETLIIQGDTKLQIRLTASALYLQPLEVKSLRASDRAPFAKTNLTKEQISKSNLGQGVLVQVLNKFLR